MPTSGRLRARCLRMRALQNRRYVIANRVSTLVTRVVVRILRRARNARSGGASAAVLAVPQVFARGACVSGTGAAQRATGLVELRVLLVAEEHNCRDDREGDERDEEDVLHH